MISKKPTPEMIKTLKMPPEPADPSQRKANIGFNPNVVKAPLGAFAEVTLTINGSGRVKIGNGQCVIPAGKTSTICTRNLPEGVAAVVEAIGKDGNILTSWAGACSGGAVKCVITPKGKVQVAATFTPPPVQQMTTIKIAIPEGAGSVKASSLTPGASAIACTKAVGATATGTCSIKVPLGSQVALVASPDAGSAFNGWESDQPGCAGFECAFGAQDPVELIARFGSKTVTSKLTFIREAAMWGGFIVYGNPDLNFDCDPKTTPQGAKTWVLTCSVDVPTGSLVDLSGNWWSMAGYTAAQDKNWVGECSSVAGGVCRVSMTQPRTVMVTWK